MLMMVWVNENSQFHFSFRLRRVIGGDKDLPDKFTGQFRAVRAGIERDGKDTCFARSNGHRRQGCLGTTARGRYAVNYQVGLPFIVYGHLPTDDFAVNHVTQIEVCRLNDDA